MMAGTIMAGPHSAVMAGLVPAISNGTGVAQMAGTSPAMTITLCARSGHGAQA